MATEDQIKEVALHYMIACDWADKPEGTFPRFTKEASAVAYAECKRFTETYPELFDLAVARFEFGYGTHPDAGSGEAAFGHDLYLTSQGHGVGFWDREALRPQDSDEPDEKRDLATELDGLVGYGTKFPPLTVEFYRGWIYMRTPFIYKKEV